MLSGIIKKKYVLPQEGREIKTKLHVVTQRFKRGQKGTTQMGETLEFTTTNRNTVLKFRFIANLQYY